MSAVTNKYLDLTGLDLYDDLIKDYMSQEQAISYKTILLSLDNGSVNFYKKANATLSDTPDFTIKNGTAITLNGTDKSGSTASLYAPTAVGTSGQVLISNGSGAPSWGNLYGYTPTYDSVNNRLVLTRGVLPNS